MVKIEKDVKSELLRDKRLFDYLGDFGENRIVYEKEILGGKVRADALIFTENLGTIGVEFKTQNDNIRRLPRQLNGYLKVCKYVFVYCHDSHVGEVEDLIKSKGYYQVGIISYEEFQDNIITGVYKNATLNPKYDLKVALSMLWKDEIRFIITSATNHQSKIMDNTFKNTHGIALDRHNHLMSSEYSFGKGVGSNRLTKNQLIRNYIGLFGQEQGTLVLNQAFIYSGFNPDKYLKLYNFNDRYDG